jgi:HEAT repeat protein
MAVVKALIELEDRAAEVFFSGTRYVQLEASWGEPVDTAAELRGMCAIGLARMAHPDALLEAVRLLSDKTAESRTGALRALADSGRTDAELVLRFKADSGDRKAEVTGECLAALLRLGPRGRAVPFVAGFLENRSQETAEAAAIALGESRLTEAWPVLRDAFEGSAVKSAVMLGISLLRNDEAIEFLFDQCEKGIERIAVAAVSALAGYKSDDVIRGRMEKTVEARKSAAIRKAYLDAWG